MQSRLNRRISASVLLLALTALTACGGGGGGGGRPAGGVDDDELGELGELGAEIHFPPTFSQTDAARIWVRGTASHPAGVEQVLVNGLPADSNNGFMSFGLDLPLELGVNVIEVAVVGQDADDPQILATATVERMDIVLGAVESIAAGRTESQPLWLEKDRRLFEFDVDTGTRHVISGPDVGEGPELYSAQNLVFDEREDRAYVTERGFQFGSGYFTRIVSVDRATGDRAEYSGPERGEGVALEGLCRALTLDRNSGDLYVATYGGSEDRTRIYRIGFQEQGDRFLVSSAEDGAELGVGPSLSVHSMDFAGDTGRLYLFGSLDARNPAVLMEVDLASGDRNPLWFYPRGVLGFSLSPDGSWAYVLGRQLDDLSCYVFQSSLLGDRQQNRIDLEDRPDGECFDYIHAVAGDTRDDQLRVAFRGNLVKIDPWTGSWVEEANSSVGAGAPLAGFEGSMTLNKGVLSLCANFDRELLQVDVSTGQRTITEDYFTHHPSKIVADPASEGLYALEEGADEFRLYRIDPVSYEEILVSGEDVGSGPYGGEWIDDLIIVPDGPWAFVSTETGLVQVDLSTGDRTLIDGSEDLPGFGLLCYDEGRHRLLCLAHDHFDTLRCYSLDLASRTATLLPMDFLAEQGGNFDFAEPAFDSSSGQVLVALAGGFGFSLHRFDEETGESTMCSGPGVGRGPSIRRIGDTEFHARSGTMYLTSAYYTAVFVVDVESGDRVIIAR